MGSILCGGAGLQSDLAELSAKPIIATHNYSMTLVEKVAGGNYLRFLRDNLPA